MPGENAVAIPTVRRAGSAARPKRAKRNASREDPLLVALAGAITFALLCLAIFLHYLFGGSEHDMREVVGGFGTGNPKFFFLAIPLVALPVHLLVYGLLYWTKHLILRVLRRRSAS
jgi:hypothetical protein